MSTVWLGSRPERGILGISGGVTGSNRLAGSPHCSGQAEERAVNQVPVSSALRETQSTSSIQRSGNAQAPYSLPKKTFLTGIKGVLIGGPSPHRRTSRQAIISITSSKRIIGLFDVAYTNEADSRAGGCCTGCVKRRRGHEEKANHEPVLKRTGKG